MIDDIYKNALKQVYDILKNTDEELVKKIPEKFMDFIKSNMNEGYQTNIKTNISINNQDLLKETEDVLALIYRSYWATQEEKEEFAKKDKNEYIETEKLKKEEYKGKDISQIFEERKNINKITIDNNLMVIKKEGIIKRFLNKIKEIFIKR